MFNFLKKNSHKILAETIVKNAKIEPVFEEGKITSFFILLNGEIKKFISNLKEKEVYSTFMGMIEERIQSKDFKDPRRQIYEDFVVNDNLDKEDLSGIDRIVAKEDYDPIFHWNKSK